MTGDELDPVLRRRGLDWRRFAAALGTTERTLRRCRHGARVIRRPLALAVEGLECRALHRDRSASSAEPGHRAGTSTLKSRAGPSDAAWIRGPGMEDRHRI